MANMNEAEVIDLSNYDLNPNPNRRNIGNANYQEDGAVIDVIHGSNESNTSDETVRTNKRKSVEEQDSETKKKAVENKEELKNICPICRNELGSQALASTECGHVFCLSCIENSLKFNKLCPTCRFFLSGKSAYHPLYLRLG